MQTYRATIRCRGSTQRLATCCSDKPSQPIHFLVGVNRAADDLQCFAVGTHGDGLSPVSGQREYEIVVQFSELPLRRGDYNVIAYAGDEHAMAVFDRRDILLSITGDQFEVGLIDVKRRWTLGAGLESVDAAAARR